MPTYFPDFALALVDRDKNSLKHLCMNIMQSFNLNHEENISYTRQFLETLFCVVLLTLRNILETYSRQAKYVWIMYKRINEHDIVKNCLYRLWHNCAALSKSFVYVLYHMMNCRLFCEINLKKYVLLQGREKNYQK